MAKKKDSNLIPILLIGGIVIYIFSKNKGAAVYETPNPLTAKSLAESAYKMMREATTPKDKDGKIWFFRWLRDYYGLSVGQHSVVASTYYDMYGEDFADNLLGYVRERGLENEYVEASKY